MAQQPETFTLGEESPYIGKLDPVTQAPFRYGDTVVRCPDGTVYLQGSFQQIGGCGQAGAAQTQSWQSQGGQAAAASGGPSLALIAAGGAVIVALCLLLGGGAFFLSSQGFFAAPTQEAASSTETPAEPTATTPPEATQPPAATDIPATDPPPTEEPSATPEPTQSTGACTSGPLPPRLTVGGRGRVLEEPPQSNRLRNDPDLDSTVIGEIEPGESFDVIGGPVCGDNINWWEVRTEDDQVGWTAEGDSSRYYVEPDS